MLRKVRLTTTRLFSLGVLLVYPFSHALAQEKMSVSGYGNVHYMHHDGTAELIGEKDLDHGFIQLREFSLFFDFLVSDRVIASTELEVGDSGNRYTANGFLSSGRDEGRGSILEVINFRLLEFKTKSRVGLKLPFRPVGKT